MEEKERTVIAANQIIGYYLQRDDVRDKIMQEFLKLSEIFVDAFIPALADELLSPRTNKVPYDELIKHALVHSIERLSMVNKNKKKEKDQ